MPKVEFVSDGVTIEVEAGTPLQEVVDDQGMAIPFGCRDGQCGTCMIIVHHGLETLQPMSEDERETLDMNNGGEKNRLCCQAIVNGDLKVEPV